MKNKMIAIRGKYEWQTIFEIIINSKAKLNDRLFMLLMTLWFIPMWTILFVIWVIVFIPSKIFNYVDDILF